MAYVCLMGEGSRKEVDSFRFLSFATRKIVQAWIKREKPRKIPFTPLSRPLAESTVALVSSAGIALKSDRPFDQEGEREDPWWGDPSFRVIPRTATEKDVAVYHLHINPEPARKDINCVLPLQRLFELVEAGKVGASAPSHYSYMGYILRPRKLLEESVPAMIRKMKEESVDVVVLVPV